MNRAKIDALILKEKAGEGKAPFKWKVGTVKKILIDDGE